MSVVGSDPVLMLTGPIPATEALLEALRRGAGRDRRVRGERGVRAASSLAWLAETGADPARTNPLGGAIALGHPLGATGARLMTTLVHHMRRDGLPLRPADDVRGRRDGERDDSRSRLGGLFMIMFTPVVHVS